MQGSKMQNARASGRYRALMGMLGLDQHEVGAIAVSRMLRDAGFEVIYAGKFNTPDMLVKTGMEENVDLVGLSCHSWEYLQYIPELLRIMQENDFEIPVVAGGSVITPADAKDLLEMGVSAVFGSSSTPSGIIEEIKELVETTPG
jgi:methylmalonyl-CoA mutase, C-terminal domain